MKPKRSKTPAILIYDGARWRLPGQPPEAAAPDAPPRAWLDTLAQTHAAVRVLLDGDLARLDTALPPRTAWDEAQALVAQDLADRTGAAPEALVAVPQAFGAGREAAVLAGLFDRERLVALREAVEAAGLRFAGVAPLALACVAAWRARGRVHETLVAVGMGQTVVAPPAPAVPWVVAGGLRHAALGPETWLERFTHGARALGADSTLRVVALGETQADLAATLREMGGFADAQAIEAEAFLGEAAALAAAARPNRLGGAVTLANPWEPRKRFSHAWIVTPCVFILALPYLYTWCAGWGLRAAERRYRTEAAQYLPLEKATEAAQKRKAAAQRAYDTARATQQALAARRLPLAAFVQAAYFFCRHAGPTVLLESLAERNGVVTATGSYADQEDGLALSNALAAFAKAEGLRIANSTNERGKDAEGLPLTRFVHTLDCTRIGGAQ